MANESAMRDLFDRWERVWHEGQYDPIPSCVGPTYIRHDEAGDRTVTRDAYAAEIAKTRQERPNIRFVVYDHSFEGARAWFRFTLKFTDPKIGEMRTRAAHAGLPDRGWIAAGDLAFVPTARLGMARRCCAGTLDEPAARQVRLCPKHALWEIACMDCWQLCSYFSALVAVSLSSRCSCNNCRSSSVLAELGS
jgi:hypothetical protein